MTDQAAAFMRQAAVPLVPVTPLERRDLLADLDAWMARVNDPPRPERRTARLFAWQAERLRRDYGTDLETRLNDMARAHGIPGVRIEIVK